jgi:hypothetical protein
MIFSPFGFINKASGYDVDAQAFFNRVTSAGGTLTTTEKTAVNQLVLDMKSTSIWTTMQVLYPMVGASAAACAQNLISSNFTGTFNGGWTFSSNGGLPNGTNAYMDTNYLPSTSATNNNTHISFYSRTNINIDGACLIGTSTNTNFIPLLTIYGLGPVGTYMDSYSYLNNRITYNPSRSDIMFINSRITNISFTGYNNNTIIGTNTTIQSDNITTCNKSVYVSAINLNGTAAQFAVNECAFASIGKGLTDTQASNLYTAVQTFQTTLSRQV